MVVAGSLGTKEPFQHQARRLTCVIPLSPITHVLALEKDAAGGQRIITASIDAANSLSPLLMPSRKLQRGFPEITQVPGRPAYLVTYDKSKEAGGSWLRQIENSSRFRDHYPLIITELE